MRNNSIVAGCLLLWVIACGGGGESTSDQSTESLPEMSLTEGVEHPQIAVWEDGTFRLIWQRPGREGSDLFIASWTDDERFVPQKRINDRPDTVAGVGLDELRPSVATSSDGRIAVAWTDTGGDVRLAIGRRHGDLFDPSIRLNQDDGGSMQSFVSVALDRSGAAHAVWLDTRVSGTTDEEPADLYYARLRDGALQEINLTDDESPSVCGCCRPDVEAGPGDRLTIAFRNTTRDGYRDICRILGSTAGEFTLARSLGPPLWKIDGCPMSGPLVIGSQILWNDASTGAQRTLLAEDTAPDLGVLLQDGDSWRIGSPPRRVAGAADDEPLVLVPGRPSGRLLARIGDGSWTVLPEELPAWATSAALFDGRLVIVGAESGALRIETRRLKPQRSRDEAG